MSKHTSGPWHAAIDAVYGHPAKLTPTISIYPVIMGITKKINLAKIIRQGDESIANARLIAAAPDLLEALQEIVRQFTKTPSTLKDSKARGKAHDAIAKATGSKS